MDFLNDEEAAWLEKSLRKMYEEKRTSVCLACIDENGDVMTAYYDSDCRDKILIANSIQMDAVMDVIRANGHIIRQALEEEEE